MYVEVPPYKNKVYFTRFFGIASLTTPTKQKSIYACNIAPFSSDSLTAHFFQSPFSGLPNSIAHICLGNSNNPMTGLVITPSRLTYQKNNIRKKE